METFKREAQTYTDVEIMVEAYLNAYYGNETITYPINPFQMLKDEGIMFVLRNFSKLEGVYIPAQDEDDIAMVAINAYRPITRQRFTAAHELCHHFRDYDKQVACPIGEKNEIEHFANAFASALLMPLGELRNKVDAYQDENGFVSFESALEIANYFGVSFEACVYRLAYDLGVIEGNGEELKKRIHAFKPDKVRKEKGMNYADLYADFVDCYSEQLAFTPTKRAEYVFEHEYIYNDSRMEGLDVTLEQASEIVSDLRHNMQNSLYCNEENEPYMSIAGHYKMYQRIFEIPVKDSLTVYDCIDLNKDLFAYYPYPEYGGKLRECNACVMGSKFETTPFYKIIDELDKVDEKVQEYFTHRKEIRVSEYIKHLARVHHRLTSIHPFADGNGRTTRAFMNVQLIRAGLSPIYIKVEEKDAYIEALEMADTKKDYAWLYEVIYKIMIRSHVELNMG